MDNKTDIKTHWKKQFNYDYLGSYSLEPGKDMILTIKSMEHKMVKNVDGKEEKCFVATFFEPVKQMILNKTNCKQIAKLAGSQFIEDWVGQKIQIYAAMVKAWGEETEALRIRTFAPKDNSELIAKIKACKSGLELRELYVANKTEWTGAVKKASLDRNAEIEKESNENPPV